MNRLIPARSFTVILLFAFHPGSATEPDSWQVTPDAAKLPQTSQGAGEILPSPKFTAKLLSPTTPSPWILIGWMEGYQDHRIRLHNLENGQSAGPVRIPEDNYTFSRLSPDGKRLVGRHAIPGGWTIGVWDTQSGKLLWKDTEGDGILPWNDFIDEQRIIQVSGRYMRVWNFAMNRLEHEIKPVDGLAVSGSVFTANRRFLARMETGGTIRFYSMPEGTPSGTLGRLDLGGRQIKAARMDVSADGLELAAILRVSSERNETADDRWIVGSWDLRDGKLLVQHELPRNLVASLDTLAQDFDIDCLPDHRGWLFRNVGILEREGGRLVWVIPREKGMLGIAQPSLFFNGNRLAYVASGIRDGESMLRVVPLPADLDARIGNARAGRPVPGLEESLKSPTNALGGTDWATVRKRTDALKALPASQRELLSREDLDRSLREVGSSDEAVSNSALERLGRAAPDPREADRVAKAIQAVAVKGKNPFYATAGWWVMSLWRGEADVAGSSGPGTPKPSGDTMADSSLAADLDSGDFPKVVRAMQQLANQKDAAAAELLVRHYEKNRALAGSSLRKMGPVANPALKDLLVSPDLSARILALDLLKKFGTDEELPALQAVENDGNRLVSMKAKEAIEAIQERSSGGGRR